MSRQLKSAARRAVLRWIILLSGVQIVCPLGPVSYGQTRSQLHSTDHLRQKLDQRVEFTPSAEAQLEQVIEMDGADKMRTFSITGASQTDCSSTLDRNHQALSGTGPNRKQRHCSHSFESRPEPYKHTQPAG